MTDHTETNAAASSTAPGLVRLVGTTPLRDVARGRLTGRLDISRACEQAALPESLRALVLRTVRATRLWRIEKADVGAELIAHFRDGLEAGKPANDLAGSFGDATLAAKLIRRTKKRARPLPWKLWLLGWKSLGALLLLCILSYSFLFIRYHTGRPVLRMNLLQELNVPVLQLPAGDRAWSHYKDAIKASTKLPDDLANVHAQWPRVPADSPSRASALAHLEANRAALEHLHAAASLPHLGYLLSDVIRPEDPWYDPANTAPQQWPDPAWRDNPPAYSLLLPSLGEFRKFAMLLAFDSMIGREQRDAQRVLRNISTTIAMAEHTRDLPFIISDLVAVALMARACDEINETLHAAPDLFTDEHLVMLAHALSAFPRAGGDVVRYDGESRFFEDALQRIYTDNGRGNGHMSARGAHLMQMLASEYLASPLADAVNPVATVLIADRASMKREHDAILAAAVSAARTPLWTWTDSPDAAIAARDSDFMWRQRYPLIGDLMAAIGRTALAQHRFSQTRNATLLALSLTLAHRQHGKYPATLAELTPGLLPAVPLDIFDGNPLRYTLVDGAPVIYSVGVDRKDDGGRLPANPYAGLASNWKTRAEVESLLATTAGREPIDGDWVLYPPLPPLPPPPADDAED